MTQFAVYRNQNPETRATFPLLVNVQSDLLGELHTQVVIPLAKATASSGTVVRYLMPTVQFEGKAYILMTPELGAIARRDLGRAVGSLAERRDTIVSALDFLLSGF
ncbi:MAG: CcdB family protein [Reyranella sp.]|uniref:CcdB family protein n=1 Tax=Reyranella sp. TaxID=1929291 RepID=UPI003D0F8DFF